MKQQILILFLILILAGNVFSYRNRFEDNSENINYYINSFPHEDISDVERNFLIQMREEEKLARDVYEHLYEKWGMRIFNNIYFSEQKHMDAIEVILKKYNIPDPVISDEPGIFNSNDIKELYSELTAKGDISLSNALIVGATIEDLDIFDLQEALLKSDNLDILFVFGNLKKGSENHIRAFTSQLKTFDIVYQAQYLTQEELDKILSSNFRRRGRNW